MGSNASWPEASQQFETMEAIRYFLWSKCAQKLVLHTDHGTFQTFKELVKGFFVTILIASYEGGFIRSFRQIKQFT